MAQEISVIDGFEDYPAINQAGVGLSTYWHLTGEYMSWSLVAGRVGGRGFRVGHTNRLAAVGRATLIVTPATERADFFAFKITEWSPLSAVDSTLWEIRSETAVIMRITYNGLRELKIWQGATLLATLPDRVYLNTYYSMSIGWKRGISDGVFRIKLNGELIANITNAKTANTPDEIATRFSFSCGQADVSNSHYIEFDDVRIDTGGHELIEEGRYFELVLNGDHLAEWTPKTGTDNWAMVDDPSSDGDTTYNEANTPGLKDLFTFAEMPFNPDRIFAMRLAIISRKVDVATRRTRLIAESGLSSWAGPDKYEGTDYMRQVAIIEKDVDESGGVVEWTKASVHLHHSGYELVE